jgi:hypothetical protein
MKKLITLSALLPAVLHADTADDYVNFIRQVQQDTGVEWDVAVAQEGTLLSPTGVSVDGSFFQLWSIHNTTVTEYLLDEQFVTAYTPNATVEIQTTDPYGPVRRTRVDQPFQVKVTVTGLLDPSDPAYPTAPDASKMVDYSHSTFLYPDGAHSLEEIDNPVGVLLEEGTMDGNTTATVTFSMTNLNGADLTQVEGEEVFTVSALADFGVSATVLDSRRVQIWPIAQGELNGLDSSAYYEDVPPVSVALVDLYPSSTTWVRVYPTSKPNQAKNVTSSYVVIEDSIPQDRSFMVRDLDEFCTVEGYHTVEILHETPFGIDILWSGSLRVDRTVEFNGTLFAGD